ncbi:MAG: dihydropteroate synthase [Prevotella sp.]|nr:dihydropteroate synthase [Prevotella sp.]
MHAIPSYTIRLGDKLFTLDSPVVMGILNVTPDSFFAASRTPGVDAAVVRAQQIIDEGGAIVDVGACSTRPGSEHASEEEEWQRLQPVLEALRERWPEMVISVDTYRPEIARRSVCDYGVQMINDVGGGNEEMLRLVAQLRVAYVLTAVQPTMADMMQVLSHKVNRLHELGATDVVVDPGFGFGKDVPQCYEVLSRLHELHVLGHPLLVGLSRKTMLWKPLHTTPAQTLTATITAHTMALMQGAHILRVHDVKEAMDCVAVVQQLRQAEQNDKTSI